MFFFVLGILSFVYGTEVFTAIYKYYWTLSPLAEETESLWHRFNDLRLD